MANLTNEERFFHYVNYSDKCWEWTGGTNGRGYGIFYADEKSYRSHRWAYKELVGELKEGMNICHHCDNTLCVNPFHLFQGTQSDNMIDAVEKGRQNNTAKTHCKHGHPFSGENLRIVKSDNGNRRVCFKCARVAWKKSWEKRSKKCQT